MTIYTVYRNSYYTEASGHRGYEFFGTKSLASSAFLRMLQEGTIDHEDDVSSVRAEPIKFSLTKSGIINLLNHVASHGDNG